MKIKYLFEIIIIVVSVMLAFLAEDWREEREDLEDFDHIIDEIEANVRLDAFEITTDVRDIKSQIHSLDLLIKNGVVLPSDSLAMLLGEVLITYWPIINTTGIDQLKNSKNEGSKSGRMMRAIYDYYLYVRWQNEITQSFFVTQIENLREYLISEGLPPISAGAYFANVNLLEDDIDDYRKALSDNELINRLKHLKNNRIHQLQIRQVILGKGSRLLAFFNPNFRYKSIGIIGSATEKGWNSDIKLEEIQNGLWKSEVSLKDGKLKFRAEKSWKYNWGGIGFPLGLGHQDGPNISVPEGRYIIIFNDHTEEYSFTKIE